MRHEGQQPRVDGLELRAAQADESLIIRQHDPRRGDRQGQRTAHQHAQAHEQRPEPVLLGCADGDPVFDRGVLALPARRRHGVIREHQRVVDPLGQTRSAEDEARLDRDQRCAAVEQIEGVGRLVDAPTRDDGELGAELIAEPPHGIPNRWPRRGTQHTAAGITGHRTIHDHARDARLAPRADESPAGRIVQLRRHAEEEALRQPGLLDRLRDGLQMRAVRLVVPAGRPPRREACRARTRRHKVANCRIIRRTSRVASSGVAAGATTMRARSGSRGRPARANRRTSAARPGFGAGQAG